MTGMSDKRPASLEALHTRLGTLSEDRRRLLNRLLAERCGETRPIRPCSRPEGPWGLRLPASSAQQRLWFMDQLDGGSAAYNIPLIARLRGPLDLQVLCKALDGLVRRHETLRTTFVCEAGQPEQQVVANGQFALRVLDLRHLGAGERAAAVLHQQREEVELEFDLSTGPLIRGRLLQLAADEHLLLVTQHHIVSDGWSVGIFVRELANLYGAYREGRPGALPPLKIQYADYARWQREEQEKDGLQRQLNYWRERLEGAPPQLELPTDRPRPPVQSHRGENVRVCLDKTLSARLRGFASQHGITLFMALYAGWAILLSRLSGQEDVLIGTPVANRERPELEGLIGLFVNTLVLRADVRGGMLLSEFLQKIKHVALGAYEHKDLPFERVVEVLQPHRSRGRNPLFQVAFVLQNVPGSEPHVPGLAVTLEDSPNEPAMFDLLLSLEERNEGIAGSVNYATDLFDRSTIERWVAAFGTLLAGMVDGTRTRIEDLPLLAEQERARVVTTFNATHADYPETTGIHELFEERVREAPEAVAVIHDGSPVTYGDLNGRANQFAHFLIAQGVRAGEYIPIVMPRSLQMLIVQLALLKCGAVNVPLDSATPAERQTLIIRDCAASRIIYDPDVLPNAPTELPLQDLQWIGYPAGAETLPKQDLHLTLSYLTPAYVMYTSGSTGVPKGVVVPQRGITRLVINSAYAHLGPADRIAHCSNPAFDACNFEVWGALLNGASIVIVPERVLLEADAFAELLERQRVTVLFITIGLFVQYSGVLGPVFARLRYVITGGDVVDPGALRRVLSAGGPRHLLCAYGPTECTTFSTTWEVESLDENVTSVPIGRPISNTCVYILDHRLRPLPIGVPGEIHIGGPGVALGYLNRPELTAERFVQDPFSADGQARMYKSGDLGRWRADGTIEYLGRNDRQVKIRGFRIELGEIETQLRRQQQVKEAVVLAREDVPGEKRLVGYVSERDPGASSLNAESLRAHLNPVLPDYMVPSAFVVLASFPLSANGKLDRKALPAPEQGAYASQAYEPPQGEVEEILAGIWQDLLRVQRVGRQDNFFGLGGHSLLIVQMMERLRRVGLSAQVRRVFESPTLADLASVLTCGANGLSPVPPNRIPMACEAITDEMLPLVELDPGHIERIVQAVPGGTANIQDIYPLAPLQEGILFHHLLDQARGDTYIVSTLLAASSRERLEELIAALQQMIDRHDVLRTAVLWEQLPEPVQVVCRQASLPVEVLKLQVGADPIEQLRERMRPECQRLDLRQAPLMRLQIAADPGEVRWYALLQVHHMTCDHETVAVIIAEVVGHLQGRLPKYDSVPYRTHVEQALAYAERQDAEKFFRGKLGDLEEPTAPFGLLDVHGDGTQIEVAQEEIEPALAQRVRAQARRHNVSAATLFHAAWALVVARTSGRDDVVFGTVLLGRLQGTDGAQRAFGMSINTLPLRLRLEGMSAKDLVERTQQELIELLEHEQASLAVAQRCSGVSGSAPLFSALLNYRHGRSTQDYTWSDAHGIQVLLEQERTNYPIVVSVDDSGESLILTAQTGRQIDPHRMTGYLHAAVRSLVQALEKSPQTPALLLSILPQAERDQVIELFNATKASYPKQKLIHELFEEQVQHTPEALAVVYEGDALTYAQLNRKANQLAHYLIEQGVQIGEYIPILMPRCLQMLIAQLGVLKSGCAYVPVDPELPLERQAFMLRDCGAHRILTDGRINAALQQEPAKWIDCVTMAGKFADLPGDDLRLRMNPPTPAYVMYTSGSTGIPKGVIVPHHAVNRLVINNGYARIEPTDCIAHCSNPAFDASTFEIWGALLNGARVLIVPHAIVLDAKRFAAVLRQQSATVLWLTIGLFARYAEELVSVFGQLRYLLVGGDVVESSAVGPAMRDNPPRHLLNAYGPTECTTFSATHLIEALDDDTQSIPIGRPISNAQIYILDSRLQAVPIGVTGEIHIGGAGVALGYLNRPEETAKRFLPDPYSAEPRARMYKSGDLGRWRADGTIEYLGRNDHQVKIRGFRIELGEIEAQLRRQEQVKEAVVLAREDVPGEKRLVGYVIERDPGTSRLSAEVLRAHLKPVLPDYMVPSAFVVLASFPLSANGKLDRKALPAPEQGAYASQAYEPPQGEVEEILAGIWQDLLRVQRVGRQDDFFELGGHSLHVIRLDANVSERFSVRLSVPTVFRYPVLQHMARIVESLRSIQRNASREIEPAMDSRKQLRRAPLTFQQLAHYNLYGLRERPSFTPVLSVTRLRGRLHAEVFKNSCNEMVRRHGALRTRVVVSNGMPTQEVLDSRDCDLKAIDLTSIASQHRDEEVRRLVEELVLQPIDLAEVPLFTAHLLRLDEHEHVLVITMEHIISDGFSLSILLRDLFATYIRLLKGLPACLPELPMQLADFAVWQRMAHAAWREAHDGYWAKCLERYQRLRFPEPQPVPRGSHQGWRLAPIRINGELTAELHRWCRRNRTTLVMSVFTAYISLVLRWCNASEAVFAYETDGRTSPKIENTIGYFASALYVHIAVNEEDTFVTLLKQVTEKYCEAYEHADSAYLEAQTPRAEFTRNTCFNWVGRGPAVDLSDLVGSEDALTVSRFPIAGQLRNKFARETEPIMELTETEAGIEGGVEFPATRFSMQTMERFTANFLVCIRALIEQPDRRIKS